MTTRRSTTPIQLNLFLPLIDFVDMSLRDARVTMERPFFALSKNKRLVPISYRSPDGKVTVHVSGNPEYGMATIWDCDILIALASAVQDQRRHSNELSRTIHIRPGELLRLIGRSTGGSEYERLLQSLDRLQSTTIKTNVTSESRKEDVFSWIDSYSHVVDDKTGIQLGMEITLSNWLFEAVSNVSGVLKIDREYFDISSGIGKWLYRVARKHAGGNGAKGFEIGFRTLYEKSGTESQPRVFKQRLKEIVEADKLPGIHLEWRQTQKNILVWMVNRADYVLPAEVPVKPPSRPLAPVRPHQTANLRDETSSLSASAFSAPVPPDAAPLDRDAFANLGRLLDELNAQKNVAGPSGRFRRKMASGAAQEHVLPKQTHVTGAEPCCEMTTWFVPVEDKVDPAVLANLRETYPGVDLNNLRSDFDRWLKVDPNRLPANYSVRFAGFVRSHLERLRSLSSQKS